MEIDDNPRLLYPDHMMVRVLYEPRRKFEKAKPAVTAVSDTKGAKFDAKG